MTKPRPTAKATRDHRPQPSRENRMTERTTQHPGRWLLAATLAIGSLDLAFAWSFWLQRVPDLTIGRVLQSIAAGWFGKHSRDMGTTSMVVGAASHYSIIAMFVLGWFLGMQRSASLRRRPLACGLASGLLLYAFMNFIVLPLSAAGMPTFDDLPWVGSSIGMHMLFGAMAAWFARKALR